jgi:hypothetical protein
MGMLTGITGYASSIQFHPNLMLKQLVNGNNVTWSKQIADGHGGRPLDVMARGPSLSLRTLPVGTTASRSKRWCAVCQGASSLGCETEARPSMAAKCWSRDASR